MTPAALKAALRTSAEPATAAPRPQGLAVPSGCRPSRCRPRASSPLLTDAPVPRRVRALV